MYIRTNPLHFSASDFQIKEGFHLDENNRWVVMSQIIPWLKYEEEYASIFEEKIGAPAKSFRLALGSLLIQEILKTSDRETVQQIKENPYLQYFVGLKCYENKIPFDPSMLVHFRKRIGIEIIDKINRQIVKETSLGEEAEKKNCREEKEEEKNKGQLMLDATVTPSDIKYPTDLGLLNHGREVLNKIIDKLYKPLKGKLGKKPRTDRKEARKDYLKVAKKKRVSHNERRKAIKKQLKYIEKNLRSIEKLISRGSKLDLLTRKEQEQLETIKELLRQQQWMYENKKRSVERRIVSIEQPYIRPIVRGKAGKSVEFGAKITVSYIDGYIFLDKISWENFNESTYLKEQVEKYKEYTGYYPESIHVDAIYRNQSNRKYCKEKGIRMSGPALGRPKKNVTKEEKKQAREDETIRNRIEGKFGESKRRYGLNLIKTKLKETSENKVAIAVLAMNLMTIIRKVLRGFLCQKLQKQLKRKVFDKFYIEQRDKNISSAYQIIEQSIYTCITRLNIRLFQQTLYTINFAQ